MSENRFPKRNSVESVQNQPQRERFVFDNLEYGTMNQNRKSISELNEPVMDVKQDKNTQVYLKMPPDYKDAYMQIINQVTSFFNEVRECITDIPSSFQDVAQIQNDLEEITAVDDISGCIEILRGATLNIVDTLKQTALHDYESLLQDAEAKVREHIRNEQQLKVALESIQFKLDDSEKNTKIAQVTSDKRIEVLIDDNAKLVGMIQKKDLEIDRLIREVSQKKQMIDLQTQTINKMISETNGACSPNRTATDRTNPVLSSQRLGDYRPMLHFPQTTTTTTMGYYSNKTPSPAKNVSGGIRNFASDSIKAFSFKNFKGVEPRRGEISPGKEQQSDLGSQLDQNATEETAETITSSNPQSSANIARRGTPTQKEKDMERARPPLKERTVQHDRHSSNISTNNLRTKEISYGSIKNLAAKLDKSTSNEPERKMRFIEELDKIFKIKRQSPAEMNANLNPMRQSKEVHQSFRNVSDVRDRQERSLGKKNMTEYVNVQGYAYANSGSRQNLKVSGEQSEKRKRPSSSTNLDSSGNNTQSKSFVLLKQQLLPSKNYRK